MMVVAMKKTIKLFNSKALVLSFMFPFMFSFSQAFAEEGVSVPTTSVIEVPATLSKSAATVGVEHEPMGNLLEVTLGLLAVLVLIFIVAWLAKRYGSFNSTAGGNLRVVGGLSLGQKERVMLVQVGEKQMLLGVSPGRVAMLHVLEEPLNIELSASATESFSDRLQSALNQRLKK